MADIVGANGKAGIPLWNYVGWLVISASVARLAEVDRPPMRSMRCGGGVHSYCSDTGYWVLQA